MHDLQYVIFAYSTAGFVMVALIIWLVGRHYWLRNSLKKLEAQHRAVRSDKNKNYSDKQ